MEKAKLYYTAPSDEVFSEMQLAAISIWREYDDTYGYATEKISKVSSLENYKDNFMYIVNMFDCNNQMKLATILTDKVCREVSDRLISGGTPNEYNYFIRKL